MGFNTFASSAVRVWSHHTNPWLHSNGSPQNKPIGKGQRRGGSWRVASRLVEAFCPSLALDTVIESQVSFLRAPSCGLFAREPLVFGEGGFAKKKKMNPSMSPLVWKLKVAGRPKVRHLEIWGKGLHLSCLPIATRVARAPVDLSCIATELGPKQLDNDIILMRPEA